MSFAKARRRIVSIVEGVDIQEGSAGSVISSTSSHRGRGGARRFRHRPEANDTAAPQDRGFWIDAESVHFRGPMHHGAITSVLANRLRASIVLSVFYSRDNDGRSIGDDMMADYSKIVRALLDPSARGVFDDNRIIAIVLGGEELASASIENVDGGKILRIRFFLEYSDKYGDE